MLYLRFLKGLSTKHSHGFPATCINKSLILYVTPNSGTPPLQSAAVTKGTPRMRSSIALAGRSAPFHLLQHFWYHLPMKASHQQRHEEGGKNGVGEIGWGEVVERSEEGLAAPAPLISYPLARPVPAAWVHTDLCQLLS